jgi:hypothetical protein
MRTRAFVVALSVMLVALLAVFVNVSPDAGAFQSDASPEASPVDDATPVATDEDDEDGAAADDSPIVTMVFWYQQNSTGEILYLSPIEYDVFTATMGEPEDDSEEGRIVFEESRNDGYPRIRVGEDDYFDAYPVYPDDPNTVQRWLYFDEDPEIRPATMVMQVVGIAGEYDGWFGTATFVSRGTEQGGIMVLAISPPAEDE